MKRTEYFQSILFFFINIPLQNKHVNSKIIKMEAWEIQDVIASKRPLPKLDASIPAALQFMQEH